MTLRDFTARVAQGVKRVTHYSATVDLSERRIKRWRKQYVKLNGELSRAQLPDQAELEIARRHARARIIYWKARKYRAEDLRSNWRDILKRRRQQKAAYLKNHPTIPVNSDGFAIWKNTNGAEVLVAPWMVGLETGPDGTKTNWLQLAKDHGWNGNLTSGVRTAAHSIELCYAMCGASTCPGRCAGAGSNHNCNEGCPSPEGAIDAEDYYTLKAIFQEIGAPLRNDLPIDPVHFSFTGH